MQKWLSSLFQRPTSDEAPLQSPNSIRSLFHKFRRILELNNAVMEKMAELERALGGEYIFDSSYLTRTVRELSKLVHQVAYSLNALSADRYVDLYDQFEYLKGVLEDILSGGLGPYAGHPTLAYPDISWESLPLVGMPNACLAELLRMPETGAVDGFVLTVTGCRALLETGPDVPEKITEAINKEAKALRERVGQHCALSIALCPAGNTEVEAGPPAYALEGDDLVEEVAAACRMGVKLGYADMAVSVREQINGAFVGTLLSLHQGDVAPGSMALTVRSDEGIEYYYLRRAHPFHPIATEVFPKPESQRLPQGDKALTPVNSLYRGSVLLAPRQQRRLAEAAIVLERALGLPRELIWRLDGNGQARILDVLPLEVEEQDDTENMLEAIAQAKVLLQGGVSAQAGVAAGKVVHIKENDEPGTFPVGAVAVARAASPQLAPFMLRAGALITELGSSIGHLATVVREYRIPAVFGLKGAFETLPEGMEVTVDASIPVIYEGQVEPLLTQQRAGSELFATDPEFTTLRRLLQFIMPLKLTDPSAEEFQPARCRSYHDIIHFAHERAVEELLETQMQGESGRSIAHRLEDRLPVNLHIIDAGGGLADHAPQVIEREQILSEPLRIFMNGLSFGWDSREHFRVSVGDIFSGMQRTASMLQATPEYVGRNLAIVGTGYLNLNLHMGYHFNVIDAFMQDNPTQNYIYFRFAGGFANTQRKNRRVELIRRILAQLQFNCSVKGDLVTARLKIIDRQTLAAALGRLGLLAAFTRQLDIAMGLDERIRDYEAAFASLAEAFGKEQAGVL